MNQRLSDIWKFITYDIWRITESKEDSIKSLIRTVGRLISHNRYRCPKRSGVPL